MKLKLAALVLACAALAAFLYGHRDWPRYWRLYREGAHAEGWVTGKSDAKTRQVYYAFQGPKKIYTDAGDGGYGNPEYEQLSEGDKVIVYFLPSNPDVSGLGNPDARLLPQHTLLVWGLLGALALAAWAFRHELGRQAPDGPFASRS